MKTCRIWVIRDVVLEFGYVKVACRNVDISLYVTYGFPDLQANLNRQFWEQGECSRRSKGGRHDDILRAIRSRTVEEQCSTYKRLKRLWA